MPAGIFDHLKNIIRRYRSLCTSLSYIRQSKGLAAPEERGSEGGRPRLGGRL